MINIRKNQGLNIAFNLPKGCTAIWLIWNRRLMVELSKAPLWTFFLLQNEKTRKKRKCVSVEDKLWQNGVIWRTIYQFYWFSIDIYRFQIFNYRWIYWNDTFWRLETRSILVAAASYKKGCLIEKRRQGAVKAFAREEGEVGGFKCQMSYVVETSSYLWKRFYSEKTGCRWRGVMK